LKKHRNGNKRQLETPLLKSIHDSENDIRKKKEPSVFTGEEANWAREGGGENIHTCPRQELNTKCPPHSM
jgi:hypothetical protein